MVVRKVTKGSSVVRTDTFTSDYVPVAETISVGPLKAPAPPLKKP